MPRRRPTAVRPLTKLPKPKPLPALKRITVITHAGDEERWTVTSFTVAEVGLLALLDADDKVVVAYAPGQWTKFSVEPVSETPAAVAESSRSERESEGGVEADDE